jgi:hypothetical protein
VQQNRWLLQLWSNSLSWFTSSIQAFCFVCLQTVCYIKQSVKPCFFTQPLIRENSLRDCVFALCVMAVFNRCVSYVCSTASVQFQNSLVYKLISTEWSMIFS